MSYHPLDALPFFPQWSPRFLRILNLHIPNLHLLLEGDFLELSPFFPNAHDLLWNFLNWRTCGGLLEATAHLDRLSLTVTHRDNAAFPELLRTIHTPPILLYGRTPQPKKTWYAIVGSRAATAYGTMHASAFGAQLALHDIGLITGLARGIDTAAIHGCLKQGGTVLAVLAGGHAHMSSSEKALAQEIEAHGGAVISERPPEYEPKSYDFPIRNRIIAGCAEKILLCEAKEKSGSLITARYGIEEHRDVFVIPGRTTDAESRGCNLLLQEGANLCLSFEDFLGFSPQKEQKTPVQSHKEPQTMTSDLHHNLWQALCQNPKTFDSLVECTRAPEGKVAGILNIWEIEGSVALREGTYHSVSV